MFYHPCRSRYRERIHVLKSLLTDEQKEEYTRALSASLNSLPPPEAAAGQLLEAGDENKVRRTVVFSGSGLRSNPSTGVRKKKHRFDNFPVWNCINLADYNVFRMRPGNKVQFFNGKMHP
jgi:hypothetical protein